MARSARKSHPARESVPPLVPLPAAAWAGVITLAATMIVLLVTFPIVDTDLWQHLLVGKVIWTRHVIPHTQLWVWPTYGSPDVLPSWLFRALLYPFWAAGGEGGLFAWRWITTLAAFGFLWLAARAAGARGPWVLPALVWCAMIYRFRSQARPETLVAVLIAAQFWLLETRRHRGAGSALKDPTWGVVLIAWIWANAHLSYYIGLTLTAFYLAAAILPVKVARPPQAPRRLAIALIACAAISFVNPFGWRALAEPFRYFFFWRHEPIYHVIGELRPVEWATYASSLLPYWLALLAVLALWRWRRRGFDPVQLLVYAVFIPQALMTQRFLGYLAVLVAPFLARDLGEWATGLELRLLVAPWARAGLVAATLLVLPLGALRTPTMSPGLGLAWSQYPVRACDWIESHGVHGRGFNAFGYGGYMLWRFWPDRGRLPFMDAHAAGTPNDRTLTAYALTDERAWRRLDDERRFDYVLLPRRQYEGQRLLDVLDADSTAWALVFVDDAAALYLRRGGPLAGLAGRERFRLLPAGDQALERLDREIGKDPALRAGLRSELERSASASAWNATAHSMLAQLALAEGRAGDSRREMEAAARAGKARPPR